jgi:hypothetical protein
MVVDEYGKAPCQGPKRKTRPRGPEIKGSIRNNPVKKIVQWLGKQRILQ